jgi:hypothetical protein
MVSNTSAITGTAFAEFFKNHPINFLLAWKRPKSPSAHQWKRSLSVVFSYSESRFQNVLMRGYQDFPQDDFNGSFEENKFVKTLVTIF